MKFYLHFILLSLLFLTGCVTSSKQASVNEFSEKGYNCIGTEPFWNVKVDKSGITFHLLGEEPRQYPYGPARKQAAASVYETSLEGSRLKVTITPEACSDNMSDTPYPYSVVVEKDGMTYQGCAFLIGQKPMQNN